MPSSLRQPTVARSISRDSTRLVHGSVDSNGSLVSTPTPTRSNKRLDHAHPTLVAGHPFKGGDIMSIGMLANPELARFAINTPILFVPPNPFKTVGSVH